jgi:ribonuclease P protein component
MLQRKNRLTSEKDFARLFSKGRPFHGKGVTMKAAHSSLAYPRVGFVVSTKVSKRAVVRNQIKRRMREVVRAQIASMAPGVDVVFMAKPDAVALPFADLQRTLIELLRKSGILRRV